MTVSLIQRILHLSRAQLASAAGVDRLLLTHLLEGADPDRSLDAAVGRHDGPVALARPGDTHFV